MIAEPTHDGEDAEILRMPLPGQGSGDDWSADPGSFALSQTRVHLPTLDRVWKVLLYVCGGVNLAVGIPQMLGFALFGAGSADSTHLVRDGVLACVLGFVCLAFAHRPRWGRPLSVVAIVVFVLQVVSGVTDAGAGRVDITFEAVHLVGAVSVVVCTLASGRVAPSVSHR